MYYGGAKVKSFYRNKFYTTLETSKYASLYLGTVLFIIINFP